MFDELESPITIDEPDFRASLPFEAEGDGGKVLTMRVCEELVDGRWEPFVSILEVRGGS